MTSNEAYMNLSMAVLKGTMNDIKWAVDPFDDISQAIDRERLELFVAGAGLEMESVMEKLATAIEERICKVRKCRHCDHYKRLECGSKCADACPLKENCETLIEYVDNQDMLRCSHNSTVDERIEARKKAYLEHGVCCSGICMHSMKVIQTDRTAVAGCKHWQRSVKP